MTVRAIQLIQSMQSVSRNNNAFIRNIDFKNCTSVLHKYPLNNDEESDTVAKV